MSNMGEHWLISQDMDNMDSGPYYESIFSLGNGYMGIRGFSEEESGREKYELCTYIAGVFDYLKPGITDMVNTPNYLYTRFEAKGTGLVPGNGTFKDFKRVLNLKDGTLTRSLIWSDLNGLETKIETTRFLSMANVHTAAIRYKITPLNYSGDILFETGIDGGITNNPISDVQLKKDINPVDFLHEVEKCMTDGGIYYINTATSVTGINIYETFSLDLYECSNGVRNGPVSETETIAHDRFISKKISFYAEIGKEYVADKIVTVYTSRDFNGDPAEEVVLSYATEMQKSGFDMQYALNKDIWSKKWDISDVIVEGDDRSQLYIRYNIFQLIQGNAENDPYVSIGARSIFHGRYKGCYFWDTEIFMLPFFAYTNPNAAKNLLMYRYNTLSGAEFNAGAMSVEGARYAWMCTIDGKEQCETWDTGCCEIHITADVAYAIDQYYKVSGDESFIRDYGSEIYIKTARYWKSRFTYYKDQDRYNMLFVKGPNEYGGVTENNTYTTMMALNNFKLAIEAVSLMKEKYRAKWKELKEKICFDEAEMDTWKVIIKKAVINYDPEKKLYIEDDNFLKQEPIDIHDYKTDAIPLYHKISFDRLQRYMVIKQADILLLMTLLPEKFTKEEKRAAWDFYEPLTLHDSTLSFGSHALFASKLGLMDEASAYFDKSLSLDLDNVMSNTGEEGLHYAAFGATWQALVNGFGGIGLKPGGIDISPKLPEKWKSLRFNIIYQGNTIAISISTGCVTISFKNRKEACNANISVNGGAVDLSGYYGNEISITL